jgi:hypothetical protein
MDSVQNVRAIVSVSTQIADTDFDILEDDEAVLVLKRFPLDRPRPHRASAILTAISIHGSESSDLIDSINSDDQITAAANETPDHADALCDPLDPGSPHALNLPAVPRIVQPCGRTVSHRDRAIG